jgi:hypothetical protein
MVQYVVSSIQGLMQTARELYGVDPIIFIVIYLACAPFWYFSLFRTLRAVATKRTSELTLWGTVFLATSVAPFVYVMIFGRNLPWWVYAIIAILIGEALWTLANKLRKPSEEGPAG